MSLIICCNICAKWTIFPISAHFEWKLILVNGKLSPKGELLKVEDESLLLLIPESLAKVPISIDEIENIKIKKKSKVLNGAIMGSVFLGIVGFMSGYKIGELVEEDDARTQFIGGAIGGGIGAGVGFLLGAGIGKAASIGKTYQVKGQYRDEIPKILKKLKKKARFKD